MTHGRTSRSSAAVAVGCALALLAGAPTCASAQPLEATPATALPACHAGTAIDGCVTDQSGAALPGARVAVAAASGVVFDEAITRDDGTFRVCAPATDVIVTVRGEGFRVWQRVVAAGRVAGTRLTVVLAIPSFGESIAVTPTRGEVRPTKWTPEFVTTVERDALATRAGELLAVRLTVDAGLHVQQTSTSQSSPYVRGLTGQQVVVLVDGVRFNTATWRPGANQYTAVLDVALAERIEVVHGPNATQYGTDSLGGTINVITTPADRPASGRAGGQVDLAVATADRMASVMGAGGRSGSRVGAFGHLSLRSAGDRRAGGARDSHSVATRLLGLPSSVLGDRLDATGYRQYGASGKLLARPAADHTLTASVIGGAQHGASRYDMLDGGVGNVLHRFDPQTLALGWVRYDGLDLGPLATLSATVSYNTQRDDREYQNINNARKGLGSDVTREWNRVTSTGAQVVTGFAGPDRHRLQAGLDVYAERVDARREDRAPGAAPLPARVARPRLPDGARYTSIGTFLQDLVMLVPDRVQVQAGMRYSRFAYRQRAGDNPAGADGPFVPDFATAFDDLTGGAGLVVAFSPHVHLTGNVSRGFRAPNVNDFGTIGVSGGGFEISPDEGRRVRASVELPAAEGPSLVSVGPLLPETLSSIEIGLRVQTPHVGASVAVYQADVRGTLERRTALLPPGATGTIVGGQPIVRQDANGAIYTPASASAVFVRVNGADIRLRGIDVAASGGLGRRVSWACRWASLRGENRVGGAPPDVENGLPPAHGSATLRWTTPAGRVWVESTAFWAATQARLSDNDLRQARIGGLRTRDEIRDFFNNGAVVRRLVVDGRLVATGETLAEVTSRVLGTASSSLLYTRHPGFVVLTIGGGWRLASHARVTVLLENLLDTNYRTIGSGVDGPGRGIIVRQHFDF